MWKTCYYSVPHYSVLFCDVFSRPDRCMAFILFNLESWRLYRTVLQLILLPRIPAVFFVLHVGLVRSHRCTKRIWRSWRCDVTGGRSLRGRSWTVPVRLWRALRRYKVPNDRWRESPSLEHYVLLKAGWDHSDAPAQIVAAWLIENVRGYMLYAFCWIKPSLHGYARILCKIRDLCHRSLTMT